MIWETRVYPSLLFFTSYKDQDEQDGHNPISPKDWLGMRFVQLNGLQMGCKGSERVPGR